MPFLDHCLCIKNTHRARKYNLGIAYVDTDPNAGTSQQPCMPQVLRTSFRVRNHQQRRLDIEHHYPLVGSLIGPLLLAPLSEGAGRVPIYCASAWLYI
jgi:hypothetical protein